MTHLMADACMCHTLKNASLILAVVNTTTVNMTMYVFRVWWCNFLRYVSKCGVLITVLTEVTKKWRKQLKQDASCCPAVGRLTADHAREGWLGGWSHYVLGSCFRIPAAVTEHRD